MKTRIKIDAISVLGSSPLIRYKLTTLDDESVSSPINIQDMTLDQMLELNSAIHVAHTNIMHKILSVHPEYGKGVSDSKLPVNSLAPVTVNIKKLVPEAEIPAYAHDTDAGMDIKATSKYHDEHGNIVYGTGLAFELPYGYVGLLFPRSSNAKTNLDLTNCVGVVDSGYRGEVLFKFRINNNRPTVWSWIKSCFNRNSRGTWINYPKNSYEIGDRIGQIIILPYPKVTFREVEQLSDSDRGEGGYGSTGK